MKQSKHTTSYWHKLMGVVLLVSVVLCNLVGLVSAKFVQDIDAGSITVAKNYYTVTYYDSDNTTELYQEEYLLTSAYILRDSTGVTPPAGAGDFLGWVDGAGNTPDASERTDLSLYPSFKTGYTVTYYNGDGTVMYKATELLTNDHKVLSLQEIYTNGGATLIKPNDEVEFQYWVNVAGNKVEGTLTQKVDYNLYPYFGVNDYYTVRFIDGGTLTLEATFTKGQTAAEAGIVAPEPSTQEDFEFNRWVVGSPTSDIAWATYDLRTATGDVLVYATYTYAGDVSLTPNDYTDDGVVDEYHVSGYGNTDGKIMVEIPAYVNGIPVTTIDENAFASFADLHCILIPNTITSIENFAVAEDYWYGLGADTVTIYYQGTKADWLAKEKTFTSDWDTGLGDGSRIFFLGEDGKVDISQGYLQAKYRKSWGITIGVDWTEKEKEDITKEIITTMKGACDCGDCGGATRPDAVYWSNIPNPE